MKYLNLLGILLLLTISMSSQNQKHQNQVQKNQKTHKYTNALKDLGMTS